MTAPHIDIYFIFLRLGRQVQYNGVFPLHSLSLYCYALACEPLFKRLGLSSPDDPKNYTHIPSVWVYCDDDHYVVYASVCVCVESDEKYVVLRISGLC